MCAASSVISSSTRWSASVSFDGQAFNAFSYFVFPDATPYTEMKATGDSELLAVEQAAKRPAP